MALPQAQRDAEGSEQRDEHSKSPAVHQDLTMASSSPWPGRCKLGIFHYLQSPNCPSGTCKQSPVGGTLVRIGTVAAACNSRIVQLPSVLHGCGSDLWSSDVVHPLKMFTHSSKLVGMSLCFDVYFFQAQAIGGLFPEQARFLPGLSLRLTPELRVEDPNCIGEAVTIKQADGGLGSSAVHSMKYPDSHTLARHKCLELVVGCMLFSSLPHMSFNHSCNSPLVCYGRSRTMVDRETGMKRASAGFLFFCLLPSPRSVCVFPPAWLKRSERIIALGRREDPEVADGFTALTSVQGRWLRRHVG